MYVWQLAFRQGRCACNVMSIARSISTTTPVTAAANDDGFDELGRFAVKHRELFGEPPSVTLRRNPRHPPV
jgi:methylphosphotriester-DNA--protein-cysteine methyltransferase